MILITCFFEVKAISSSNSLYVFKVIIAGDTGVGKTTFIRRYINNSFIPAERSTIGVDYYLKNVNLMYPNFNSSIALQIWDLAGEERFKSILPVYYIGTNAIILVFSEDKKSSLTYLSEFIGFLKSQSKNLLPVVLIKAKNDLHVNFHDPNDVKSILEANNIQYFYETSSKTGENINEVFQKIAELILKANGLI